MRKPGEGPRVQRRGKVPPYVNDQVKQAWVSVEKMDLFLRDDTGSTSTD